MAVHEYLNVIVGEGRDICGNRAKGVAAGANVYQFGRFETADGFWSPRLRRDGRDDVDRGLASDLDLVLGPVALALDAHGLSVMKQSVQQG